MGWIADVVALVTAAVAVCAFVFRDILRRNRLRIVEAELAQVKQGSGTSALDIYRAAFEVAQDRSVREALRRSQLEHELSRYEIDLAQKRTEIEHLRHTLAERDRTALIVETQLASEQVRLRSDLQNVLAVKERELSELQKQRQSLEVQLSESLERQHQLQSLVDTLERALNDLRKGLGEGSSTPPERARVPLDRSTSDAMIAGLHRRCAALEAQHERCDSLNAEAEVEALGNIMLGKGCTEAEKSFVVMRLLGLISELTWMEERPDKIGRTSWEHASRLRHATKVVLYRIAMVSRPLADVLCTFVLARDPKNKEFMSSEEMMVGELIAQHGFRLDQFGKQSK